MHATKCRVEGFQLELKFRAESLDRDAAHSYALTEHFACNMLEAKGITIILDVHGLDRELRYRKDRSDDNSDITIQHYVAILAAWKKALAPVNPRADVDIRYCLQSQWLFKWTRRHMAEWVETKALTFAGDLICETVHKCEDPDSCRLVD